MIDIMKQGLGLRTPQQERFGNSQELKSFGGRYRTRTARPRRRRGSRTVLRQQIAQNPEPFQGQRLKKGSGFLILRYSFVQAAIAFLFSGIGFHAVLGGVVIFHQGDVVFRVVAECRTQNAVCRAIHAHQAEDVVHQHPHRKEESLVRC